LAWKIAAITLTLWKKGAMPAPLRAVREPGKVRAMGHATQHRLIPALSWIGIGDPTMFLWPYQPQNDRARRRYEEGDRKTFDTGT